MKKILFIIKKPLTKESSVKQQIHNGWVDDCRKIFDIQFWGKGYTNTSIKSLQNKIDSFKPDYIYMTKRKNYFKWLPDLTNIKVPKIYVEVDTYKYNAVNLWYTQFDKVYRRSFFDINSYVRRTHNDIGKKIKKNISGWCNAQIFKWSIPCEYICSVNGMRHGIYHFGAVKRRGYKYRKLVYDTYKSKDGVGVVDYHKALDGSYWSRLYRASALLCPTESDYGDFVPAKLFEYLASGSAVITNCDLVQYGCPELEKYVIKYKNIKDLKSKLFMNFVPYHGKALKAIRNHTHIVRYKELFT